MMRDAYVLKDMSAQQLADLRAWQTDRLDAVTQEIKTRVQAEYQENESILQIAKKHGVTRRTVYAWVKK